jgi:transposase
MVLIRAEIVSLLEDMDVICRHSNHVHAMFCAFKMFKKIEKPAACEMRAVICFLNARNVKPTDIQRQFYEVYGEHTMSDSVVSIWVRHFYERRENVHDDPWSGRPSVVNEDLVRKVEEKIQEKRRFTISSLSLHFTQISWSLLYEIVSDKLRFQKLCSRRVPKILTDEHKMKQATWHA